MTTSRNHVRARVAAGAAVAGALLLVAAPAWAHVEPSPAAVEAGSSSTISFGVEHGCEDSPTTKIEIQIPDGVTDAVAGDGLPDGWTGTLDGDVLAFSGPAQPSDDGFDVSLTATFPGEGEALSFPLIQTCEQGTIDWIDPVVAGAEEPEHPAPTVTLTAGQPTEEQAGGEHEEGAEHEEGEEGAATTTTVADETGSEATTTVATGTDVGDDGASVDQAAPGADSGEDDGDSSNTGLLIGGIIVAVVLVGGGVAFALRRQGDGTGPTGDGA